MRIFLAATSLLPSFGGPATSVSKLAVALAEAGEEVGLWASDQSAVDSLLFPDCSSLQLLTGTHAQALQKFGKVDVLHDNGLWRPHNHRLAQFAFRHGIARAVSPRGMLEPWALTYKPLKKKVAWWAYQQRDLRRAHCHHTTSLQEARNLKQRELGVKVVTVPNGVDIPAPLVREPHCDSKTALFLGRIHPVKGLPMLMNAWGRVRPKGWVLRIAGPDEAGHRKEVEKVILANSLSEVVQFVGPVGDSMKSEVFRTADLLILPSHSESFGMVVAEALAYGLPVLTTKGTPWSNLKERGCGWWIDPTVDGLVAGLLQATGLQPDALRAMGEKGREMAALEFGWKRVAKLTLSMYQETIEVQITHLG